MKMKGRLDKKILILLIDPATNENGFENDKETECCNPWAKVSNMSGTEMFRANADYSKVTTKFIIRYRKDITTDMKIRFQSKLYNITYVNNYNFSNEYLELIGQVIE